MFEFLGYEFMRNAFMAGALTSIICGTIGVYVVLKRIVFISGGIAHFSFGGIGFGYLINFNPMVTTLIFSLGAAVSIGLSKKKVNMQEDTTIGILWAIGMALGIVFVGLSKGYAIDLFSYLFGSILAVSRQDLYMMVTLCALIMITVTIFYKELLLVTFDEEYGNVLGAPTNGIYIMLLCLVALSIVVMIKVVGVILVIALLTIPASTSRLFSNNLKKMILFSILVGLVFTSGGLLISYYANLASGATIVIFSGVMFFITMMVKSVLDKRKRNRALNAMIQKQ
ncbi:MAG TPA: metal ABC transporter permease [Candidatus Methanofastidiosa archaeon]|nr:metal ABC transporter permease [Candidatus Methanofastidiosa archaeon]HPR41933.1 metal ABC transporter permease [Candidatus Methanofastidiosa archaeon]